MWKKRRDVEKALIRACYDLPFFGTSVIMFRWLCFSEAVQHETGLCPDRMASQT